MRKIRRRDAMIAFGWPFALTMLLVVSLPAIGLGVVMILWYFGKLDRAFPKGSCKWCGNRIGRSDATCEKCGHAVNRCNNCDYNLTDNVSGVCPECGVPI